MAKSKTRIEIELDIDKRELNKELDKLSTKAPKIKVNLPFGKELSQTAKALENAAKAAKGVASTPGLRDHYRQRNWKEDVEGDLYAFQINRARQTPEKNRTKEMNELLEGFREEQEFMEKFTPSKESLAVLERLKKQGKLPAGGVEFLDAAKTAPKENLGDLFEKTEVKETIADAISVALSRKAQRDKAEEKRITAGIDKVVQMDGVRSLMKTTGEELKTTVSGGNARLPIKQQKAYMELLAATSPLLREVGLVGVVAFTKIGVAVAALTALSVKLVLRMREAEEFAKSIHMIGNELQGLATRINVLGYYTDDMINQFVSAQVQAEKLAWQNRFLTEEDKQLAETFRGLSVGLSAFCGTLTDLVGQLIGDFLPSFESVREFMVTQVAPAIGVVVTAFEVMGDGIKTSINLVLGVLSKFISAVLNVPTYIANVGHNVSEIFGNIMSYIGYGIEAFIEDYIFLLPDHFTNFIKGFGENFKKFGENILGMFTKIGENIAKFFSNLSFENLRKAWKGEMTWSELFSFDKMENPFENWDSESAKYKRDASGKVMLDENGNKIIDTERGFVDTDAKMRENKKTRDALFLRGRGLSDEDMKDPEKVAEAWSLMRGTRNLSEGTEGGWSEIFSKVGDDYFSEIGKTLDKYSGGIQGLEDKNKEKIAGLMDKNWQREAEKSRPTFNMGPWEKLQTLLNQNQRASTESLASAYDRINNAVANRNPVVEAIQKQMESQKQFEAETKEMDKKSLEYQEKSKEQEEKMAGALQGIYDFLQRNNPQLAAVVEG